MAVRASAERAVVVRAGGRAALAVCGVTLLAGILAFLRIGRTSFWEDEGASFGFARAGGLWHVLRHTDDPNMTLYYALLHVWLRLGLGDSEAALRALSAIFAALTVPAVYLLGARLFGRRAGLWAALLLAVNAFVVRYAQEARGYTLVLLLVTLSSYFFVVELERASLAGRAGYVLTSALAFYSHFYAALVVLAQLGTLAGLRRRAALGRGWVATYLALAVLCVPGAARGVHVGHRALWWVPTPSAHSLWRALVDLSGRHWGLLAAGGVAACWGAFTASTGSRRWQTGFVSLWLVLPVVLSFAFSFVEPFFVARYLIVVVPALALLAGAGLAAAPSHVLAALVGALVLALSGLELHDWYAHGAKEDWRDATRFVLDRRQPADVGVFFVEGGRAPFDYYAHRYHAPSLPAVPRRAARSIPGRRVWLLLEHVDPGAPDVRLLEQELADGRRVVVRRSFGPLVTELFARGPAS